MVIDRGAFLAGRYAVVLEEIRAVKAACGTRPPQGDPRDGRARHARQRAAGVVAGDGRRCRLHQDVDRQGRSRRPRLPVTLVMLEAVRDFARAHRHVVGVKAAGGIRTAKEAVQYLVLVHEMAGAEWLRPDRFRFGASSLLNDVLMQRRDAAHRPLRRRRPGDARLMAAIRVEHGRTVPTSSRRRGSTRRRPRPATSATIEPSYGLFIGGEFVDAGRRRRVQDGRTRPPRRCWPRSPTPGRPTSTPRCAAARRAFTALVEAAGRGAGQVPVPHRPARSRSGRASWRCSSRSTTASRSRRPATSTCRSSPPTSSTTRAGPTSWPRPASGPTRSRSAWPGRSSRGTSRC